MLFLYNLALYSKAGYLRLFLLFFRKRLFFSCFEGCITLLGKSLFLGIHEVSGNESLLKGSLGPSRYLGHVKAWTKENTSFTRSKKGHSHRWLRFYLSGGFWTF